MTDPLLFLRVLLKCSLLTGIGPGIVLGLLYEWWISRRIIKQDDKVIAFPQVEKKKKAA